MASILGPPEPPQPEPPPRPHKRLKPVQDTSPYDCQLHTVQDNSPKERQLLPSPSHLPRTAQLGHNITPPPSSTATASHTTILHSLGKLVRQHYRLAASLGWHTFICHLQQPKDTTPNISRLPHPAAPLLARLAAQGVPAPSSSAPWTQAQKHHYF